MLIDPPTARPPADSKVSEIALFWFLQAYIATHKRAFRPKNQKSLADATGLKPDTISRIVRDPPNWFCFERGSAYINYENLT